VKLGGVEDTSFASEEVERACLLYFFLGDCDGNDAFGWQFWVMKKIYINCTFTILLLLLHERCEHLVNSRVGTCIAFSFTLLLMVRRVRRNRLLLHRTRLHLPNTLSRSRSPYVATLPTTEADTRSCSSSARSRGGIVVQLAILITVWWHCVVEAPKHA